MRNPRKTSIRPPRLKSGSRIGLVAPAGPLNDPEDLRRSTELVRALGWEPVPAPHVGHRDGYLAGSDSDRLADLNAALIDPALDGVWCLRGGYGVTRILDQVDYEGFALHPKPVLGYSDITALLVAITTRTHVVTYHGPVARHGLSPFSRDHLELVLTERGTITPLRLRPPPPPPGWTVPRPQPVVTVIPGTAEGILVGGNLTLLHCLMGTSYFPDLRDAILFLEDVGEPVYAIDRMLSHLRLAGALSGVAGVAVGHFSETRGATEGTRTLDRVLSDYFGSAGIPVVHGVPIGHVDDQWTVPIGVPARLDATSGVVELLESSVS